MPLIIKRAKGGIMMVWLKSIRGQKVILNGKCIGRVLQGVLCDTLTALDGIWIDRSMLGMRFISAEHICVFGDNSVLVDHPGERLRMKPERLFMRAVNTVGDRLGAITDAAIDEHMLLVNALALNRGWFDICTSGLITVRHFSCSPSSSRVIIPEEEMEVEP